MIYKFREKNIELTENYAGVTIYGDYLKMKIDIEKLCKEKEKSE